MKRYHGTVKLGKLSHTSKSRKIKSSCCRDPYRNASLKFNAWKVSAVFKLVDYSVLFQFRGIPATLK